jgi:hypothetical protein
MRTFVLIAAALLASASVQAAPLRSLSLASSNDPVIVDQSSDQTKTVTAPPATAVSQADQATQTGPAPAPTQAPAPQATEAPKFVEREAVVPTTTTAATSDTLKTDAVKSDAARPNAVRPVVHENARAQKTGQRNELTVARVIHELHRHGIYW